MRIDGEDDYMKNMAQKTHNKTKAAFEPAWCIEPQNQCSPINGGIYLNTTTK